MFDHEADHTKKPARSWLKRAGGFLFTQALAFFVLVGFPALFTAIAPVSWITFERHDGRVSATTRTCCLFVIPYRWESMEGVTGVNDRTVAGTVSRDVHRRHRDSVKSEDEGFLVIQGDKGAIEISVSPASIPSVVERVEEFLNDSEATQLKLFVVANWKFSVIAGGLVSLLAVLYFATWILGIIIKSIHLVQMICGVPAERRCLAKFNKKPTPSAVGGITSP